MRIIGIDPGTSVTGIGVIEILNGSVKLIHFGNVTLNSKDHMTVRLKKIYDQCLECINKYKPQELAIETAFYSKNIQSTLKLGQARGVAIIAGLNSEIRVSEYSPREVKKSVTGNGASSKDQVMYMVSSILNLKKQKIPVDSSDALAIAICHSFNLQSVMVPSSNSSVKKSWKSFLEKNPERILTKI
ncbi:MAG TPA: crossover junction endodeoxyribonuclease RuvC [Ignavibacteria bacterium]|nr:crossover junction endodeoxyribonuclease RuvC [Bacteroidota bacterium]HRI85331.1 crossover junction endodeoxyribonuclease RuvC [Ignavibacteria bacterium]HRJ98075.1 crossover junction endodeoxyribonuclease RuvC [Ignavibacteria bacterium]